MPAIGTASQPSAVSGICAGYNPTPPTPDTEAELRMIGTGAINAGDGCDAHRFGDAS